MAFKKAEPEQGYLKMSMYGPPGSGKSFSALLFAEGLAKRDKKRIAYVDTERGTDFYAKKAPRDIHPEAFDFDALYTTSLADVLENVKSLDPKVYGVVVIDSISHLWDAAMAAYEGKKTSVDGIPMHAWGQIKKPYKELIRFLMDGPFHVFILGRQKNIFENDGDDKIKKVGVGMRAEGETSYEPHICARMEAKQDEKDSTYSTNFIMFEKDRTGCLAGRTFPNPGFKIFDPVMPLLNGKQAVSEDPEEVSARDSELLEKEKEKKKAKEDKSANLFAYFISGIETAENLDGLNVIAADIKKQKRYLQDAHMESLRIVYDRAVKKLTAEHTPVEV